MNNHALQFLSRTAFLRCKLQKQQKPDHTSAGRSSPAGATGSALTALRLIGAGTTLCVGSLFFGPAAFAHPLKFATWNMEWLLDTTSPLSATAPADIPHRTAKDLDALAAYAQHLNANVIGFQEVATPAIAARIFPSTRYQIYMTQDAVLQRTGAAVRLGLRVIQHPDFTPLALDPTQTPHALRSGLDLTLQDAHSSLRLLVVHLKTGCWDNPPTEKGHSCPLLVQQFTALRVWVSARQQAGEAFAIMGDFNRRMTEHDPLFQTLARTQPLTLTTAGQASPCAGAGYFIDHIMLGGPAKLWPSPRSLRVMLYKPNETAIVSDHCAVSVLLNLPEY